MKLIRDFSTYSFFSILEKAIQFLFITILTYFLTKEALGVLATIDVFILIGTVVCSLNIDAALTVEYFKTKYADFNKYYSQSYILITGASLVLFLLIKIFEYPLSKILSIDPTWLLYIPMIILGRGFLMMALSYFQVQKKAFSYGLLMSLYIIVSTLLSLFLVVYLNYSFDGILWGYLIAAVLVTLFIVFRSIQKKELKLEVDKSMMKDILKFSLPLIPIKICHLVINLSDRYFVAYSVGLEELGVYHVGYTVGSAIFIVNVIFEKTWTPYLYEMLGVHSQKNVERISKVSVGFVVLMIVALIGILLMATIFFNYIVQEKFAEGIVYVFWVGLSYVFYSVYQLYSHILFYHKKVNMFLWIAGLTIIINLILNWILILEYGAIGAAYSTVLSFIFLAGLTFFFGRKYFDFQWGIGWKALVKDFTRFGNFNS